MIVPERKKLATIIVAKMHGPGHEEAQEDGEQGEHMEGIAAAMSDFLEAIDRKSPRDMAEAFHAAFVCAEAMPHEENEEGEEEEPDEYE